MVFMMDLPLLFELVVVVVLVVEDQPTGDEGSRDSMPLSEKLPNWSDRFGVAALSHLPIFKYGRGLVEADPVERGASISFGEPGTTVGLVSATGDFGAGAATLLAGGERTELPRAQALEADVVEPLDVTGTEADHSFIVEVATSRALHPLAIFEEVASTLVSTTLVFSTVFLGDTIGHAISSTVFTGTSTAAVSSFVFVLLRFCVFLLFFSCCTFLIFGLATLGGSTTSVLAAISVSVADIFDVDLGSAGFGVGTALVTFNFFVQAPVSTGYTTRGT